MVKNPPAYAVDAEDTDSIPGWKWYSRGTNGYQLWYSCLENPMGRRAWRATVQGVSKELDTTEHTHTYENHLTNTKKYIFGGDIF